MWNPLQLFRKANDASDVDIPPTATLAHFVDAATGDGSPWTDEYEEFLTNSIPSIE